MDTYFYDGNPYSLRDLLEEFSSRVPSLSGVRAKGESSEDFAQRVKADKETVITRMAVNTGIAAKILTMQQIVRVIREGSHLASTPIKFGDGKTSRRDVFLGWLDFIGIGYTVHQSDLSRLVKFYVDTLPVIERVSQRRLSDTAISTLHSDQGDITSTYIQRIVNEWVETFERTGSFTKKIADRILDELEADHHNATALSEELRAIFSSSVSTPETLSETSVRTEPQKAEASYRELTNNRIRLVIEIDRSMLPMMKKQLSKFGIDIESLRVLEE